MPPLVPITVYQALLHHYLTPVSVHVQKVEVGYEVAVH